MQHCLSIVKFFAKLYLNPSKHLEILHQTSIFQLALNVTLTRATDKVRIYAINFVKYANDFFRMRIKNPFKTIDSIVLKTQAYCHFRHGKFNLLSALSSEQIILIRMLSEFSQIKC
jgi:hypothetical protein